MLPGKYGIEFSEPERSPWRRLAWLLLLLPVLLYFVFKGGSCSASPEEENPGTEEAPHFDASATRQRPSFWGGLFRRSEADATNQTANAFLDPPQPKLPPISKSQPKFVRRLLELVRQKEREDDLLGARLIYLDLLEIPEAEDSRAYAERRIAEINHALLLSTLPAPEKIEHTVVKGDLFSRICKQYRNNPAYVLKINRIEDPSKMKIGQKLLLLKYPDFRLTVYKRDFSAVLTLNGSFFKRFSIGLGEVAAGEYLVRGSVEHPVYRRKNAPAVPYGAPGNILGTWWISLSSATTGEPVPFAGLHGTWDESSLGRGDESGFVRFSNADIDDLAVLLPAGTKVSIVDK